VGRAGEASGQRAEAPLASCSAISLLTERLGSFRSEKRAQALPTSDNCGGSDGDDGGDGSGVGDPVQLLQQPGLMLAVRMFQRAQRLPQFPTTKSLKPSWTVSVKSSSLPHSHKIDAKR
jgi:hypothetical protein